MATGYVSLAKTKEAGPYGPTPLIPFVANKWIDVDFGTGLLVDLPTGPSNFIAQLYFEGLPAVIFKMSIRVIRGTGNATGQDDFLVKGPVWARCYPDIDFPAPPDNMRGIQFFSEKPGLLATHVLKVENSAAYGGARLTPTSDD